MSDKILRLEVPARWPRPSAEPPPVIDVSQAGLWPASQFGPLIGVSTPMRALFARLARLAPLAATVLVEGETGTGKELVARALHEASPRASRPFMVVDCGALPESLLEAELFGHCKGAFTGASETRVGAIEEADGGTVFLDEIGELPLAMQTRLLRVLERRTVRRLGEAKHRPVDVRFIAATHRDLPTLTRQGNFREDLYFRLAVVPVRVPPLRERPIDVEPLVRSMLPPAQAQAIPDECLRDLAQRPWPGNVRELRNFVERAVALGPREALALTSASHATSAASPSTLQLPAELLACKLPEARARLERSFERAYLTALLARHDNNISQAARAAGVNRTYLHRLVARHRQL